MRSWLRGAGRSGLLQSTAVRAAGSGPVRPPPEQRGQAGRSGLAGSGPSQASCRAERTGRAVRAGGEQAGQASARAESGQCGLELMPSPAASEFMLITQLSVNL